MCSALSVPSFLQSPDPMLSVCGVLHLGGQGSEQGGGGNGATRGHARLSLPTRGSSCLRQLHKACWGFQQILTRKENKLHWLRDVGGGGAPLALLKAPPRPFPTSQILAETFPGSCATSLSGALRHPDLPVRTPSLVLCPSLSIFPALHLHIPEP